MRDVDDPTTRYRESPLPPLENPPVIENRFYQDIKDMIESSGVDDDSYEEDYWYYWIMDFGDALRVGDVFNRYRVGGKDNTFREKEIPTVFWLDENRENVPDYIHEQLDEIVELLKEHPRVCPVLAIYLQK